MANINIASDAWTEISITSGTIQNISATADIELSAEQTDNSGVVLKPSEIYQWDNETIYARAVTEDTGALRVVNFKRAAGGGGGYVLPVASASTLGGVKVGNNLSIDASGVLSATGGGGGVNYSTTEQQIGTWINGKPLYQRVFVLNDFLNISYNGWTETGVSIADNHILDVIFAVGYYYSNVDSVASYPMLATGNIAYRTSIALQTARNGSQDTINAFLLQYTKTTD